MERWGLWEVTGHEGGAHGWDSCPRKEAPESSLGLCSVKTAQGEARALTWEHRRTTELGAHRGQGWRTGAHAQVTPTWQSPSWRTILSAPPHPSSLDRPAPRTCTELPLREGQGGPRAGRSLSSFPGTLLSPDSGILCEPLHLPKPRCLHLLNGNKNANPSAHVTSALIVTSWGTDGWERS